VGNTTDNITAQDVKDYLLTHKDFLLNEEGVLASLELNKAPQGTISLAQRQTEQLKNNYNQLKVQLTALIDNAQQNTDLQLRIHQLCLKLMDAVNLTELTTMILAGLQQEFNADKVALRLFYHHQKDIKFLDTKDNIAYCHHEDDNIKQFDKLLNEQKPVCGRLTNSQKEALFFDEAAQVKSIAFLPLGDAPCIGFLAIASYDEHRFHSDMATDYLHFLSEVIMRLLRQYH